jgi:hypothetical protein
MKKRSIMKKDTQTRRQNTTGTYHRANRPDKRLPPHRRSRSKAKHIQPSRAKASPAGEDVTVVLAELGGPFRAEYHVRGADISRMSWRYNATAFVLEIPRQKPQEHGLE